VSAIFEDLIDGREQAPTLGCGGMADLHLRPMSDDEYAAFRSRLAREYAAAHVEAGNWDASGADQRAAAEMDSLLPRGPSTPGALVLSAEADGHGVVGRVWIALERSDEPGAWIYQIEIDPEHRGRGYGRALLAAAEREVRRHDGEQLGLNVFAVNAVARKLYESSGYETVTLQMRKRLTAPADA
jgi:ribosomal protein S18 acetylase RimI-like enzyme